jgi:N-acyl-D-amino-acid deacylase
MKLLIKNAFVIDGSGKPGRDCDILIEAGVIKAVERELPRSSADEIYDAHNMVLAPGFIDVHSHSDLSALAAPEAFGKVSQGVTSEIVGNCGLSAFPVTDLNREHLQELWRNYNVDINWNSCSEYLREVKCRSVTVNLFPLVGHNTLRAAVAGYEKKELSAGELAQMRFLLAESLEQGAAGFSTGLLYVPGKFSETTELISMLEILAGWQKPYTTHLRSEGNYIEEALAETFGAALAAGQRKVHISHLKTAGQKNWHKIDKIFELVEAAGNDGLTVTADRYPYTESMTQLSIILPEPYDDMDDVSLEKALNDEKCFSQISQTLAEIKPERWSNIRLLSTKNLLSMPFSGKSIQEISKTLNLPPHELCMQILRDDAAGTLAAFRGMSDENMRRIIQAPFTACGTDESARPLDFSIGRSHPRGFGSFPRFFNVLQQAGLPLEQIIERVTSLPARIFNLCSRGIITPGYMADMVLFDPDKFADKATFASPHSPAEGIISVWINGTQVK